MLLAGGLGFRLNETPSVPVGLWRVSAVAVLERGRVVSFCPPPTDVFLEARRRGYLKRGNCPGALEPMLKVLAGLPGDEVLQTADALFINGRALPHSKALKADAQGRPLPALASRRFVDPRRRRDRRRRSPQKLRQPVLRASAARRHRGRGAPHSHGELIVPSTPEPRGDAPPRGF